MSMSTSPSTLDEILLRVASIAQVKTDAEVALALGVKPQSLANWKSRGSVPYERLIEFASLRGVALDYVFFGWEPKYRRRTEIDARLLADVGALLEGQLREEGSDISRGERYFYIGLIYNRLLRLPEDVRSGAVQDEVKFLLTAVKEKDWDALAVETKLEQRKISPAKKRRAAIK